MEKPKDTETDTRREKERRERKREREREKGERAREREQRVREGRGRAPHEGCARKKVARITKGYRKNVPATRTHTKRKQKRTNEEAMHTPKRKKGVPTAAMRRDADCFA
jgi:hypothetical protein